MKLTVNYTNLDTNEENNTVNFSKVESFIDWDDSNNIYITGYTMIDESGEHGSNDEINAGAVLYGFIL